jgi:hypothetical protein
MPHPAAPWPPGWGQHYPPLLPPGAQPPEDTARRNRRTVEAIAVVLAIVVLTGVAFVLGNRDTLLHHAKAAVGRQAQSPASPAPTFLVHDGDLSRYVLAAPAGSRPWKTRPTSEKLDLQAAAEHSGDQAGAVELLQRAGFVRGFARQWIDDTYMIVEVRLLRFGTAEQATRYRLSYAVADSLGGWGDGHDVPGIDYAKAFIKTEPDGNGYIGSLAVADAGDAVVIVVAYQRPPGTIDVPNRLLTAEYAKVSQR